MEKFCHGLQVQNEKIRSKPEGKPAKTDQDLWTFQLQKVSSFISIKIPLFLISLRPKYLAELKEES